MKLLLDNRVTQQRFLALLMTLLCSGIFGWCSGMYIYTGVIILLALAGYSGRYDFKIRRSRQIILFLIIALIYAFYYRLVYIRTAVSSSGQLRLQAQVATQYFLFGMASIFYFSGKRPVTPWIMICGIISVLTSGQLIYDANANRLFQVLAMVYLAMIIALGMLSRVPLPTGTHQKAGTMSAFRWGLAAGCFGLTLWLGWFGGEMLNRYHGRIVSLIFKMQYRPFRYPKQKADAIGFDSSGKLNSLEKIKLANGNQVAFRIFSDQPPGYIRNKVFESYSNGEWESSRNPQDIEPYTENLVFSSQMPDYGKLFVWTKLAPDNPEILNIWPAPHINSGMFTPLGTMAVQCDVDIVTVDDNGIIDSDSLRTGIDYSVAVDPLQKSNEPLAENKRSTYLTLPLSPVLDPQINNLAREIFKDCKNTSDKLQAVVRYFQTNYDYQLGIEVPNGQDPLNYFLLKKPPAHCEFFASGATILLRLGNVPTRYVTGAVADEYNAVGEYWVARNKDAHAWCEAWNEDTHRWELVEATPASGVPQRAETNFWSGLWETLRLKLQELSLAYVRNGFRGMALWILTYLGRLGLWLVTTFQGMGLLLILIILLGRKRIIAWRKQTLRPFPDERIVAFHELLSRMERILGPNISRRMTGETLHQYSRRLMEDYPEEPRIREIANWYLEYAIMRYGITEDIEQLNGLRERLPEKSG